MLNRSPVAVKSPMANRSQLYNESAQSSKIQTTKEIKPSSSESQFILGNRPISSHCLIGRNNNIRNRTTVVPNNVLDTPTENMTSSVHKKESPKINFSYSQKRQ